ncbi:MAG: glycosyltransferase [Defluviitaleaceae bacterium]|nr:glycosyltransferase [Defluviitaleaceae bacterium]
MKISIIIPCYDAEKRIKEALDSVLNQSLIEIEVICVDDGSTDRTLNMLKAYENNDSRVKVLTQKNQYAGVARNRGLIEAKGKYVYFMDADDLLMPTALEKVFAKSEMDDADICFFGAGTLDLLTGEQKETYPLRRHLLPKSTPFSYKQLSSLLLVAHHIAPWNRLYKKSFIEACGIEFQALKRSNDLFFCVATVVEAKKITRVDECLYMRTIHSGTSLVETMDEDPYSFYHANKKLSDYFVEKGLYAHFQKRILKLHLDSAAHVLSKLKDQGMFQEVALFLKETYFIELGIWENKDLLAQDHRHLKNMTFLMETPKEAFKTLVFNKEKQRIEPLIKVSVIIPCYNAERFLKECLDSILNQTLKEIEVICIDDGSTDTTVDILKAYAEKDHRFSYLTQENQYAGVARNRGLEIAKGKYLSFLDADDLFEPIMLETMYHKSEEDIAEICITAGGKYDLRTKKVMNNYRLQYHLFPKKTPFSSEDVLENVFSFGYTPSWNKLYKRSFVERNALKFQEIPRSNDVLFTQSAIAIAKRITVADGWMFHYRVGSETSLVETMDKHPLCFYDSYVALQTFLVEQGRYEVDQVRIGFKKSALGSGLYALRMTKTKAGWLQIALFLKNTYIPELELLEVRWKIPPTHKKELAFLLENTNEQLEVYEPALRVSERVEEIRDSQVMLDPTDPTFHTNPIKVSVIVEPSVSNDYLLHCLSSIKGQTLTDIEMICIVDPTVEKSLEVLQELAKGDNRLLVLSHADRDLSALRNQALKMAQGEYVIFVKGTDLLLKFTLENVYRVAKCYDLDQLLFEGAVFYETVGLYDKYKNRDCYLYKGMDARLSTGKKLFKDLVEADALETSLYMKLYKVTFLRSNGLSFSTGSKDEQVFSVKSLIAAERAMIHKELLYLERVSLMTVTQAITGFNGIYEAHQNLLQLKSLNDRTKLMNEHVPLEKVKMDFEEKLQNAFLMFKEKNSYIPTDFLNGITQFLSDETLDENIQNMYLAYMESTLKIETKPEDLKADAAFSEWLARFKFALNHMNAHVLLTANLNHYDKNMLLNLKKTGRIQSYTEIYHETLSESKNDILVFDLNHELVSKLSALMVTIKTFSPKDQGIKIAGLFENLVFDYMQYDFYFENSKNEKCAVNLFSKFTRRKQFMDMTLSDQYAFSCEPSKSFWVNRVYLIVKSKKYPTVARKVRLKFEGIHTKLSNDEGSHLHFGQDVIYYGNDAKTLFVTSDSKMITYLKKTDAVFISENQSRIWDVMAIKDWYPSLIGQYDGKHVRLFMDDVYQAHDNAEALIKYFEQHKNLNEENYFIIDRDSADYRRLRQDGLNVVAYKSFQHLKLLMVANQLITSRSNEEILYPFKDEYGEKIKDLFKFNTYLSPSNLVKSDILEEAYGIELIMSFSNREVENLKQNDQLDADIFLTGLPRLDGLEKGRKGKTIVIAPNWNRIDPRKDDLLKLEEDFIETSYFKKWHSLLSNERLVEAIQQHDYEIVFVPHPEIRHSAHHFETEHVRLADFSKRYQDMIHQAACLVTDQSSIHHDFACVEKQVFYYQPDEPVENGYFDYEKDGFGPVLTDEFFLVDEIINGMKNGFEVEEHYIERKNKFFAFNDQNNCQRVYEVIKSLEGQSSAETTPIHVPNRSLKVRIKGKIKRMIKK